MKKCTSCDQPAVGVISSLLGHIYVCREHAKKAEAVGWKVDYDNWRLEMTDPIKCPYCGSLTHRIGMTTSTLMMYEEYTDDEGRLHHHDPNKTIQPRHCRGCGGSFQVITRHPCPSCDYGRNPPEIVKTGAS